MSWDADLYAISGTREIHVRDWNYTHNCNGMIAAAYQAASGEATDQCGGPLGPAIGPAWWDRLDGASGEDGRAYLGKIVGALEADPAKYRAMNPSNGWGDYDSLLAVLREMLDLSGDGGVYVWHVSG